jgi:putative MATE family efflux protein
LAIHSRDGEDMLRAFKDKEFMKKMGSIALPIIIQQLLLTTFGIVDTVMVGSIERGIAGVGLASQLSMIATTIVFGVNVGVGLYIAQFMGKGDEQSIKKSFALMTMLCLIVASVFTYLGAFQGELVLRLFSSDPEAIAIANDYLKIAAWSYVPNMLTFSFAVAYRNIQKTKVPMAVSFVAMLFNVTFNALLIFGLAGFPKLGVRGAAMATVLSTSVGLLTHIVYAWKTRQPFSPKLEHYSQALHKPFRAPIMQRTMPFVVNELFFSVGSALYIVIFNRLGTDAYEGYRIAETIVSVMFVVGMGLFSAAGAMIGQQLGKSDFAKAKIYADNFLMIGVFVALLLGTTNVVLAKQMVSIFQNTNAQVVQNAIMVTMVFGLRVALRVFVGLMFSIFRAGGKSKFVMFLDAGVMWLIGLPLAYVAYHFLGIDNIAVLFLIIQAEPAMRIVVSVIAYRKNLWQANIVNFQATKKALD